MNQIIGRIGAFISYISGFCITLFLSLLFGFSYQYIDKGLIVIFYLLFTFILGKLIQNTFFSQEEINALCGTKNPSMKANTAKTESTISLPIVENESIPTENREEKNEEFIPIERAEPKPHLEDSEPEKDSEFIVFLKGFFVENALAKIGGILFFIGVLFLMALVYNHLGPLGKLLIGFALGFGVYGIGFFIHKKGFVAEGNVLIGLGVVINYLVILSGRYLIQDTLGFNSYFLGSSATFVLLILNSIFGAITALRHESKNLLFFSFFIAYLTPILIGAPETDFPYSLLGYNLILTFGGFYLVHQFFEKESSTNLAKILLTIIFLGGNFLSLVAPATEMYGFFFKIFTVLIVTILPLLLFRKRFETNEISLFFCIGYIFLFIGAFSGIYQGFSDVSVFFTGLLSLCILSVAIIYIFFISSVAWLLLFLFLPFGFLILGFFIFSLPALVFIGSAFGVLQLVFILLFFISPLLSLTQKTFYFGAIIIMGIIFTLICSFSIDYIAPLANYLVILGSSLVFLIFGLYESRRSDDNSLYLISVLGTIFMIFPLTFFGHGRDLWAFLAIGVYFIIVSIFPFVNPKLMRKQGQTLFAGLFSATIFLGIKSIEIGQSTHLSFNYSFLTIGVGCIAGILALFLFYIADLTFSPVKEDEENIYNSFFAYILASFSLLLLGFFQLWGASEISYYALLALIGGSTLMYFTSVFRATKLWMFSIIFFILGMLAVIQYRFSLSSEFSWYTVFFIVTTFSLSTANLVVLGDKYFSSEKQILYHIIHLILLFLLVAILHSILNTFSNGTDITLMMALLCISLQYGAFYSSIAEKFYFAFFTYFLLYHSGNFTNSRDSILIADYITTTIVFLSFWVYWYFIRKFAPFFVITITIYLFYATTFYVSRAFDNSFIVTFYWGMAASLLVLLGIQIQVKALRTIGLYVLFIAVSKIVFIDIWAGLNNSFARVIALMFVGGAMVALSMLYKKLQSGSIKDDLRLNYFLESENSLPKKEIKNKQNNFKNNVETKDFSSLLISKLKEVDVDGIKEIRLILTSGKNIKIVSKGVLRVVKLALDYSGKTEFAPNELLPLYEKITREYKSELPEATVKRIQATLLEFVKEGGNVEVIEKEIFAK